MGTEKTAAAFEAAFHDNDCQSLIQAIETFAASRSTTPGNIIDVLPCVHTGMVAIFARKEDEARKAWKPSEANEWREARAVFERGMREFIRALEQSPNPERENRQPSQPPAEPHVTGWGRSSERSAIGDGWGLRTPKHDAVPA